MFFDYLINFPNNEITSLLKKNRRLKTSSQNMAGTRRLNLWRRSQFQPV